MAAIDTLKTLIGSKISDGKKKLSAYVNEKEIKESNCIAIYYTGQSDFVSTSKAKYYGNRVQVTVRYETYDKARSLAFDVMEYINSNRHNTAGVYFIPETVPVYLGVDQTAGYVWGFEVSMKGSE